MKKQILIIIGAVIILILILVWAYIFLFGTPKSIQDSFSNFNIGGDTEQNLENNNPQDQNQSNTVNVDRPKLRQLTTKPVAGYSNLDRETPNSDLPNVYYVEMGTGHIYSINLNTGEENRISATTIAGVNTASISRNGKYVAMGNLNTSKNLSLTIGEISTSTNELTTYDFSKTVDQFKFSTDGKLLYTVKETTGLFGYSYDPEANTHKNIFELPFHEANVQWGNMSNSTHYAYTKPTYLFEGYGYEIKNNKITRLPVSGFGFTGVGNDKIITYSISEKRVLNNYIYNRETREKIKITSPLLPEKCLIHGQEISLFCAFDSTTNLPTEFPDTWYRGEIGFKDSLWSISGNDMSFTLVSDLLKESGREIDVINIGISDDDRVLYFINKNDNTLWMYEI